MFTTAAQLLDLTDRVGINLVYHLLASTNGFILPPSELTWGIANLVLQDTIERIFIEDIYADIPRGIFLVRGENVLLLGEIDLDKDDYIPEPYRKASPEEVHALTVRKNQNTKRTDKIRQAKLQALGFEAEHSGEVLY
ncbi:MAG: hypothetical protein LQ337_008219 [Flavoplaca oasis]|nr:MAG: hypothetical protein LQ337_008219 [Flavoplaca oasis]